MLAKVRQGMVYVARGITPLSQGVVSSFIESSYVTFLSSASSGLDKSALAVTDPSVLPFSEKYS